MGDTRTANTVLEDVASGAGRALHAALAGDAAAGKNAHGVFIGKDPSGNLQYASLNAANELRVSLEQGDATHLAANGTAAGNTSFADIATITLSASKVYRNVGFLAACFRDAEFKIVSIDNGTPTVLALGILVGAGQLTAAQQLSNLIFTSGATGAQTLKLQAKNFNVLSDFRGTLTVDEIEQI